MKRLKYFTSDLKFPNLYAQRRNITNEDLEYQLKKFKEEFGEVLKEDPLSSNFRMELLDMIMATISLYEASLKKSGVFIHTDYDQWVIKINERFKNNHDWGIKLNE